ncbi:MAG: hypothetical protein AAGE18_12995 [Pseudomonadota bacterium]
MARRLYIHCGLHKTGSTALQHQMSRLADRLAERGVLLPLTSGRHGRRGVHHGLAHHVASARRFAAREQSYRALAAEIAAFEGEAAYLSSEDFEAILGEAPALERLKQLAEATGAALVLVLYLRSQIEYAESLYLQSLRMGYPDPADAALAAVLDTGTLRWRRWCYHFDYQAVVAGLEAQGFEVRVRSYHRLVGGSTASDMLDLLGQGDLAEDTAAAVRRNPTRRAGNIAQFARNALGEEAPPAEHLAAIDALLGDLRVRLGPELRAAFAARFDPGNALLDQRFPGLALAETLSSHAAEVPEGPRLEHVFSKATLEQVQGAGAPTESHLAQLTAMWRGADLTEAGSA